MSDTHKNSMAAVLSFVLQVVFWLALTVGFILFVLLTLGILGSLNGGELSLPGAQLMADGVPMGQLVGALIGALIFFTGFAYVIAQLRRILQTLADGDPFVPENAPRLTRIAIAIALVEIVRNLAALATSTILSIGQVNLRIDLAVWGAVIVLLILAQVFKEGTRLREEEKMTI
ncbi:MAG: DUF2975 domain-containing protein [Henriciella sp.]|nr:DUF2975 domain-containing protein [Hyphomonadaceae bacterium]